MRLSFDLDGTLYDTLEPILKVDNQIRQQLGYEPVSKEQYTQHFQTSNWRKFYSNLGIRNEHLDEVINNFVELFAKSNHPQLIPGAKEIVLEAEKVLGKENVSFITNEQTERVYGRFERDGLLHLIDNVRTPFEGKAEQIYELAGTSEDSFFYVGDLISDGKACLDARKKGADTVYFFALLHQYSFNSSQQLKKFVTKHKGFAETLNNLEEIRLLWNRK